ncbi:type II toxin-antitoxin system HicB family antitoxin [Halocatena halophila]|uniref:type II toxin-antitoxin system HicB family antitoxin n=1 Tax=Halocatena halophila TaxID=2814576 RepID=UPI002ED18D27
MVVSSRDNTEAGVVFTHEGDLITAIDIETGLAASGSSKAEALSSLADVLELHEGGGEPIEDEDAFLIELGIDADEFDEDTSPPSWMV